MASAVRHENPVDCELDEQYSSEKPKTSFSAEGSATENKTSYSVEQSIVDAFELTGNKGFRRTIRAELKSFSPETQQDIAIFHKQFRNSLQSNEEMEFFLRTIIEMAVRDTLCIVFEYTKELFRIWNLNEISLCNKSHKKLFMALNTIGQYDGQLELFINLNSGLHDLDGFKVNDYGASNLLPSCIATPYAEVLKDEDKDNFTIERVDRILEMIKNYHFGDVSDAMQIKTHWSIMTFERLFRMASKLIGGKDLSFDVNENTWITIDHNSQ